MELLGIPFGAEEGAILASLGGVKKASIRPPLKSQESILGVSKSSKKRRLIWRMERRWVAGLGEVLEGRRSAGLGIHLKRRRRVLLWLQLEEDYLF